MTSNASSSVLRGIALALIAFALFATHDAMVKSIKDIHSFQIVFFVVLFSFVPFAFVMAFDRRERSLRPNLPGMVALRSLFSVLAVLCAFYAFGNLPLAQVYSLLFSAPVLITLLAIPLLGEKIHLIRWIAIILGMAGVLVVLQPGQTEFSLGHLAALGSAIGSACASVVTRKIGDREHSITLVIYPMLANIIVSGILLTFVYAPMSGETLAKLCAIGLLSVIGQSMMVRAYRTTEAQFVAPMQYSQMLWALLYGALVFNETIDITTLAGAAIIVFSGLLFIWRELSVTVSNRPTLSARNLRATGGPSLISRETDKYRGEESTTTESEQNR